MKSVLLLGGYGNFGKRIAAMLIEAKLPIIIAGRRMDAALHCRDNLLKKHSDAQIDVACFDVDVDLEQQLKKLLPTVVINTCGPFQDKQYTVALECIAQGVHYIDLSDGRAFVNHITQLNVQAEQAQVAVISGASTVPGLSSAVLEAYKNQFQSIDSLIYGISPGQKADRGLATTEGILSYVGKPLQPYAGQQKKQYGWQDIYLQKYPVLGKRWMANCNIPDLDLFTQKYGIKKIKFSAGMESSLLHLGIWFVSWLVRLKMPLNLKRHAGSLLKASHWFDCFGSDDGGMHMIMCGIGLDGKEKNIRWFIVAKDGDGPQIPIIPAVIIAKKIMHGSFKQTGSMPCVGLVTLDEYLLELKGFHIKVYTE